MLPYADIVLPLAQPAYTFAVPEGLTVSPGDAVAVPFGPRKIYTGIVWRVHAEPPAAGRVKTILRRLYDRPLLPAPQMRLWEWVADYYLCTVGEVMRAALPSLMKPSGDTEEAFSEEEFRPRTECYVALSAELHDEARFHEACERLERRAPKQYEALLEVATAGDETRISTGEVARRLLRADYGTLQALCRKGLLIARQHERTVERGGAPVFRLPELTPHQQQALAALRKVVHVVDVGERDVRGVGTAQRELVAAQANLDRVAHGGSFDHRHRCLGNQPHIQKVLS